jgi:4-amino-4-deoxy-L-arabinose transferase-like glycosyltransferase
VALSGGLRTGERLASGISGARAALALELSLLAGLLVAQGFLFARGVPTPADYDEGVYLAAVDALRHGQELGSEIFTAQPPGYYWLLDAGATLFGSSLDALRAWMIALALLGCVAAWLLGRAFGGSAAGFGAALLLGVAPPYPTFASRISADLPAYVLALFSLVCFVYSAERRRPLLLSGVAGVLLAAAVSVKLSALTAIVPLAALAVMRRPAARALAVTAFGAGVVTLTLVAVHWGAFRDLWFGAVTYHRRARDVPGPGFGDNAERVLDFLDPRTPFGWLVPVALLALLLVRPAFRLPLRPLWLWAAATALLLVWHRPLHDNHLVALAVTVAVPAGIVLGAAVRRLSGRAGTVAGLMLGLALAAGYAQEARRLERNQAPEPPEVVAAANELAARTRPDELVVTDRPIIAFRADRRVPGEVLDSAALAFDAEVITSAKILEAIDRHRIRAVVAAREFRNQPEVLAGLRERFPTRLRRDGALIFVRG